MAKYHTVMFSNAHADQFSFLDSQADLVESINPLSQGDPISATLYSIGSSVTTNSLVGSVAVPTYLHSQDSVCKRQWMRCRKCAPKRRGRQMSRIFGSVFAACLLAIATSTTVPAANANWPKSLTLGTASPGGVYYVYGDAVAKTLTEKLGIPVNPLPTQGPVHNVKLIESGGAQLGLVTMGVALQAWKGMGEWQKPSHNMRALFPMYDTSFQFTALRRSDVSGVAMLDKLDVGAGPRAGTGGVYVAKILSAIGISARMGYGSWEEAGRDLLSGRYNAVVMVGGAPFPTVQELEKKEPLNFISLSGSEIDLVRKAIPELSLSTIPAGTYTSLGKDYTTVGVYNFAVGRADLPDDLVYNLVKAVFDNQPRLVSSTDSAKETVPQNVLKDTFLPFHPGAVRYYREIGINIPDSLAATN